MNLKENEILRCPMCGGHNFIATAHVTQDWEIDAKGNFQDSLNDCIEVTHSPDRYDIIECSKCGHSDRGSAFIVELSAEELKEFYAASVNSDDTEEQAEAVSFVINQQHPYAVITTYSWEDAETQTMLFETEEAAKNYLRNVFEAEVNEEIANKNAFESEISEDGSMAKIINYRRLGDVDTTIWQICSSVYVPANKGETSNRPAEQLFDEEALLRSGEFLLPGDKVLVSVPAYRMWGGRCREDTKAPPVDVAGIVLNTNIDRDENTGELIFACSVAASVPIADTDREYFGTWTVPMGMCTKVEIMPATA